MFSAFSAAQGSCSALDYDEAAGAVRMEFSNFPLLTFYDNGVIQAGWSHNQGLHPVREFVFRIDVLQNGPVRGTGSLLARGGGRFRLRPRRRGIGGASSGNIPRRTACPCCWRWGHPKG
mgnify:CR=1 FL=1